MYSTTSNFMAAAAATCKRFNRRKGKCHLPQNDYCHYCRTSISLTLTATANLFKCFVDILWQFQQINFKRHFPRRKETEVSILHPGIRECALIRNEMQTSENNWLIYKRNGFEKTMLLKMCVPCCGSEKLSAAEKNGWVKVTIIRIVHCILELPSWF